MLEDSQRDELNKLNSETNNKFNDWIKNLIVMESSLLAILISFHSVTANTVQYHLYYTWSLILIGTSILAGAITLYGDIYRNYKLHIKLSKSYKDKNFDLITMYPSALSRFIRIVCVVSFFVSIPLLITYAILIDKI